MKKPIALVLGSLFALGCSSERRVDFQILTDAPPEVLVTDDLIEIPAGMAIGVRAVAVIDGERREELAEFFPERSNIVGFEPSLEERTWVIWGKNPGSSSVEIYLDGDYAYDLTAVTLEPALE